MDNDTHVSIGDEMDESPGARAGDGPMTASQAAHLKSLAGAAGIPVDLNLSRREAAKRIDELEGKMARGTSGDA